MSRIIDCAGFHALTQAIYACQVEARVGHAARGSSVPAFAGGFLYLLSAIIISSTLPGAPTVGVVQGLTPALEGVANPAVSPSHSRRSDSSATTFSR